MVRYVFQCLVMALVTLMLSWWGLFAFSSFPISPADALAGLFSPSSGRTAQILVHEVRLPRVIVALMVGANLACAGALMQALTQNSLASPGLFGVNAGAAMGVAFVSTFWVSDSPVSATVAAIFGGGGAWALVMILGGGWRHDVKRSQLVLAGIAISALCGAVTKASVLLVEEQASSVMVWLAGSFASVAWDTVFWLFPVSLLALIVSLVIAPKLNLMSMGEERAVTLGVNLMSLRLIISLLVLVLVGGSVSAVGSIAFVGLMVPHICRFLFGYDYRKLLPLCVLSGGLLCVAADIVSRVVSFPVETPAGAVLALIGAPGFLYLVRRKS
ncbi:iron chelate uptake ABC transporter family permease subunit [Vibrio salinus]|uniref:iron chelate uptake ABC transporter family permease subunit n=1 Tax=Vibrio salinus TaxID=2899784 RepID=UPI001E53D482|nr:iron chelate uptake ABC transporter family permease subunit [Vibrio salinus]MCE0496115.1 iron chelate uptake ABC transporter family permease subunit [Vibrio salinus]